MAVVSLTQAAIKRLSSEFIADPVVPGLRVQAYDGSKKYLYRYNDPGAYTIRQLIDDYAVVLARTKRGHERERMLRHDLKAWYARPAATVRAKDIRELVEAIAEGAPGTSGRIVRELRAVYRGSGKKFKQCHGSAGRLH